MILARLVVAVGVAVVAFGVVAVAVIEALGGGGDVGPGIVGVGVGAIVAIGAFTAVALLYDELAGVPRCLVDAVGAFGLTLLGVGAVVYVDVVPIETTTALAVAAVVGILTFAGSMRNRQEAA